MHVATDLVARAWSTVGQHARRFKLRSPPARAMHVSEDEHVRAAFTPGSMVRCSSPGSAPRRLTIALRAAISGVEGGWVDQAFRTLEEPQLLRD